MVEASRLPAAQTVGRRQRRGAAGKSRSHSHHKYNHKAIALVHYNTCEEEAEAAPAAPGASRPGGGVAAGRHSHSEIKLQST